jgi:hypothetical protein
MIDFPILLHGRPVPARLDFAKTEDLNVFRAWSKTPTRSPDLAVQDAAEFAALACKRWRFYCNSDRFARNLDHLRDRIRKEPESEVAILLVAKADWHKPDPPLGVCLCRRTWSNGLCVDFVTVSPMDLLPSRRNIAGVGKGLLYFVSQLAREIEAISIWGEATSLSAPAYRHMFEQQSINDFFHLSSRSYRMFARRVVKRWNALRLQAKDPKVTHSS